MREKAYISHIVIGYSGIAMLIIDYNIGSKHILPRMRFLNKNTGEEIARFYLDRNSIKNLADIFKEVSE